MELFLESADNYRLFARSEGSGEGRILFVHGFPFDHSQWMPQLEALGNHATMVAPDLRGLGGSEGPGEPAGYSMQVYASDLEEWLNKLEWERALLVGLSMGGYILFEFLRHYSERLLGLILMDTHPYADSTEVAEGRRRSQDLVRSSGTVAIVDGLMEKVLGETTRASRPEVADRVRAMMLSSPPNGVIGALEAMAGRRDSSADLEDVSVPVLIVTGEEDILTPPARTAEWAPRIPGSAIVNVPEAGHVVSVEAPDRINGLVRSFVEELI